LPVNEHVVSKTKAFTCLVHVKTQLKRDRSWRSSDVDSHNACTGNRILPSSGWTLMAHEVLRISKLW